ncbi:MAG: aminoglycoside phosphotransferase family protein [Bacillota bacterium]
MIIPEFFKDKIIRVFGQKGNKWLSELPDIIDKSKQKWDLSNLSIVKDLSFNFICTAKSSIYGDVVLKIAIPSTEFITELKALSYFKDDLICQVYDYDKERGTILLERIIPGDNLLTANNDKWLEIAADISYKLPVEIEDNDLFPDYKDWINKAFNRAKKENKMDKDMLNLIDKAETIFYDIEKMNYRKVLLHGDLHHWNILFNENKGWKAIDPKGVIGISVMESARFLDNQITITESLGDFRALDNMISVFSNKFSESKLIVAQNLFILLVLSTCWSYENHFPKKSSLKHREEKCRFVNNYI